MGRFLDPLFVLFLFLLSIHASTTTTTTTTSVGPSHSDTLHMGSNELLAPLVTELAVEYTRDMEENVHLVMPSPPTTIDAPAIKGVVEEVLDFAMVSSAVPASQYALVPDLQLIPIVVIPLVFTFNVPEVDGALTLSLPVVSDIWGGSIIFWNDSRIQELNPKAPLPNAPIMPLILEGETLTTQLFTEILSENIEPWHRNFGIFSNSKGFAPSSAQLGNCQNTSQMADRLRLEPYTIGYMVLNQAIHYELLYAAVLNGHGNPTMPIHSFIVNDLSAELLTPQLQLTVHDLPGRFTYPALRAGHALIRLSSMKDCAAATAVAEFISWILMHDEPEELMFTMAFIHLPIAVTSPILSKLLSMTCQAKTVYTETIVNFGGPSTVDALMADWPPAFMEWHSHLRLTFLQAESSDVMAKLKTKEILFGMTANDLTDKDYETMPGITQIPVLVSAAAIVFNLPEKRPEVELVLSREALVGIFNGEISQWNDPLIRKLNPFVHTPAQPIEFVVMNKSSSVYRMLKMALNSFEAHNATFGEKTTFDATSASLWPPSLAPRTVFQTSHETVLSHVQAVPYTIAVVNSKLAQDAKADIAHLHNLKGEEVLPSTKCVADAAANAEFTPRFTTNLMDRARKLSYPIVATTNFVFFRDVQSTDCTKYRLALDFLQWTLQNTSASDLAIEEEYVPVFNTAHPRVTQILRSMTCNGELLWPYPPESKIDLIPIVVPCVVAIVILSILFGVGFWRFRERMKFLTAKLNDARIAVELSDAIATLDLEKMTFLETIERPTTTQRSCLRILRTLKHVKKYVPVTVVCQLQKEVNGEVDDDDDDQEEGDDIEKKKLDDMSDAPSAKGRGRGARDQQSERASDRTFPESPHSKAAHSESGSQSTGQRRSSKFSWSSSKGAASALGARTSSLLKIKNAKIVVTKATGGKKYNIAPSESTAGSSSLALMNAENNVGGNMKAIRREMTAMVMVIANFETLLKSDSNTTLMMFNRFFDKVVRIANATNGMLCHFDGRHILFHWNAAKRCSMGRLQACEVAGKVLEAAKETLFQLHFGIAHGPSIYTNLGCDSMSSLLVLGPVWNRAHILAKLNEVYESQILVDEDVRKQGPNGAMFSVDVIECPNEQFGLVKRCRVSQLVCAAVQSATDVDGEWLYAFQQSAAESSVAEREACWAKCADAFFKGNFPQAHDYILAFVLKFGEDAAPHFATEVKAAVEKLVTPTVMSMSETSGSPLTTPADDAQDFSATSEFVRVVSPIPVLRLEQRALARDHSPPMKNAGRPAKSGVKAPSNSELGSTHSSSMDVTEI